MQNAEEPESIPGFYPRVKLKSVFPNTTLTLNLMGSTCYSLSIRWKKSVLIGVFS